MGLFGFGDIRGSRSTEPDRSKWSKEVKEASQKMRDSGDYNGI